MHRLGDAVLFVITHRLGDAVLFVVTHRLGDVVCESGTTARVGGEEFVVLLNGRGAERAGTVADRVLDDMCTPVTGGALTVRAGARTGGGARGEPGADPPAAARPGGARRGRDAFRRRGRVLLQASRRGPHRAPRPASDGRAMTATLRLRDLPTWVTLTRRAVCPGSGSLAGYRTEW
ncbi:diguanylate cyclase domain-containing protein [Kineosporia succinea]|uniref:GGDEF domain-containing protein n=1 Tax=Kineosporia succinea TaxID=84632 RepID=A0ABT9NX99_9ACTN|nr:diguanylate cyclase [Kineosporia succinea]MDP9825054.1 GGDEF domain-containing protein [Kineosporia succinea]